MQGLLERTERRESVVLEIRAVAATPPPVRDDLETLGTSLLTWSRLLLLEGVTQLDREALEALTDPLLESATFSAGEHSAAYADVFYLPGVTDAEGETASLALDLAGVPDVHCRAGIRYRFSQPVPANLRPAVERLIGNPLVQSVTWGDAGYWQPSISSPDDAAVVEQVPLAGLDATALARLSREHSLALDGAEMRAIQSYFDGLGRSPTDVEYAVDRSLPGPSTARTRRSRPPSSWSTTAGARSSPDC